MNQNNYAAERRRGIRLIAVPFVVIGVATAILIVVSLLMYLSIPVEKRNDSVATAGLLLPMIVYGIVLAVAVPITIGCIIAGIRILRSIGSINGEEPQGITTLQTVSIPVSSPKKISHRTIGGVLLIICPVFLTMFFYWCADLTEPIRYSGEALPSGMLGVVAVTVRIATIVGFLVAWTSWLVAPIIGVLLLVRLRK